MMGISLQRGQMILLKIQAPCEVKAIHKRKCFCFLKKFPDLRHLFQSGLSVLSSYLANFYAKSSGPKFYQQTYTKTSCEKYLMESSHVNAGLKKSLCQEF